MLVLLNDVTFTSYMHVHCTCSSFNIVFQLIKIKGKRHMGFVNFILKKTKSIVNEHFK